MYHIFTNQHSALYLSFYRGEVVSFSILLFAFFLKCVKFGNKDIEYHVNRCAIKVFYAARYWYLLHHNFTNVILALRNWKMLIRSMVWHFDKNIRKVCDLQWPKVHLRYRALNQPQVAKILLCSKLISNKGLCTNHVDRIWGIFCPPPLPPS